ncbi:estrogen receptor [Engraulis encrasicolus]|uniref:estrogen receptor n=1 Tax=Engraulis encrasicolus TaxID=184585 RepID=UPI002FD2095D
MYPPEERAQSEADAHRTEHFLDSTYDDITGPAPVSNPSPSAIVYSDIAPEDYGSPTHTHTLAHTPDTEPFGSPMIYVPSSPQLSPFLHTHTPPPQTYTHTTPPHTLALTNPPAYTQAHNTPPTQELCYTSMDTPHYSKETRYCAVCSDYASGYHYGVWSCEGCKAFFKRSIQGQHDYMCPATNQCTMDRSRRKSCQACRLRRCLEVGMTKGGFRKERGRRAVRRERPAVISRRVCGGPGHLVRRLVEPPVCPEEVLQLLINAEPPVLHSRQQASQPYTDISLMTLLTSMADRELVHMITWAKKIPGFQALSLHEQVKLLEGSWMEVLMTGLIWRSINAPGKLVFAQDLILDRSEGKCVEGMQEIFDMLLATVSRFRTLKLTTEEFVCLKAIVLLNSGAFCLEPLGGVGSVQTMLDTISHTLIHYISQSGAPTHLQARRHAQLLLLLSHIRHMSNKGMEHLYSMKCQNKVPLYDLLLEMLDAHRVDSNRLRPVPGDLRSDWLQDGSPPPLTLAPAPCRSPSP